MKTITSRVVRFHQVGGPEVLQTETLEVPAPGAGELRVQVQAIGLNRAEAVFRRGKYLEAPALPARLGYEASAIVEALGDGVSGFTVGEAVSIIPAFSMNRYGVYAEHALVPAHAVVKRPAGLSAIDSAAVWMAYLTAYGALIDIGRAAQGDAVIIPAASSSVGLAAIQIVNSVGGISIATTRTSAKAEALKKAGAAHVIVTSEQDLLAEVMRVTEGQGARLVFDPVRGPGVTVLAQAMRREGILFVYGGLSAEPTPFPVGPAMLKGLSMRGYTLFEITGSRDRLRQADGFVRRGIEAGVLRPVIARVFPFDEIVDAHRYLESNEQIGKIVVSVSA